MRAGRAALPARPRPPAAHHQGRADGGPGREPALGHRPDRAARPLHPLLPDLLHHGPARCAGSTRTRAGSGCSSAGRPCTARRAWRRATASSFRSRSGPFSASGPPSTRARRSARTASRAAACRAPSRLSLLESPRGHGRLLHAHLRAAPGRGGGRRGHRAAREPRAGADRGGRAGRQHPRHARAHRAGLGRPRHRPPWPDRGRARELRVLGGARLPAPQREPASSAKCSTPRRCEPVPDGSRGELVVTSLGRAASPMLRYRTGDIVVRRSEPCACGRTWARLEGGILARADDMVNVRGVNVYPAAIEAVVRGFPGGGGVPVHRVAQPRACASLTVEIEARGRRRRPGGPGRGGRPAPARGPRAERPRQGRVEPGALPRFEMKARRFVVEEESR